MIAVIHQPHFFPWAGYFNKLANADCFIAQDNVQFRRRYFQNRTLVRGPGQQRARWLTLPVHSHRHTLIKEVLVGDKNWRKTVLDLIIGCYRRAPFFPRYIGEIDQCLQDCPDTLIDINLRTIKLVLQLLNLRVDIRRASDFARCGAPAEQLAQLCVDVGATNYIFGEGGGLAYHGTQHFQKKGITTHHQDYRRNYLAFAQDYDPQCLNLSIIDLLFHLGAHATSDIVRSFWHVETAGESHADSLA